MALQYAGYWSGNFPLLSGAPDAQDQIGVYIHGTNTLAVLYSDHLKSGTVANPFVTHPTSTSDTLPAGNGEFYAVPGYYDLVRYATGQFIQTELVPMDPADPGAGGGGPGLSPSIPQPVNLTVGSAGSSGLASDAGHIHFLDITGLSWKQEVAAATIAALPANTYNNGAGTLTGNANGALAAVDSYTAVLTDRLLVKSEAAGANLGIYSVTQVGDGSHPYILTRTSDANSGAELNGGATVYVANGTVNAGTTWTQTVATVVIGTTAQTWVLSGSRGRTPHIVVAASGSPARWTAAADYVCTGTNDHTTINTAITALGGNGVVELSPGTFNLGGSITLGNNQILVGQGFGTQLLRSSGTSAVIAYNGTGTGSANHVSRGGVRDVFINGNSTAGAGIQCRYADTAYFVRVHVDGTRGEALQCVEMWDSTFVECRFNNCGSVNNTGTPAVGIYQTLSGVPSSDNCNNIRFFGCTIEAFVDGALNILGTGTGTALCYEISFESCKIESIIGMSTHAVTMTYTERVAFRNCFFFHGPFAVGISTPMDTVRMSNSIAPTIEGCQFVPSNSVRSLRSYISLFTNVQNAWIANLDLQVLSVNFPTVAAIDNNDAGTLNYNNQVDVYDFSFDGHGGSTLYNQGVGRQRVIYNPTSGDRAGPMWSEASAQLWGVLHYQGTTTLVVRDWTNSRYQVIFTQGASATAANTQFESEVQIDSDLLRVNGVGLGTSTSILIDNDTGQDGRLTFRDLSTSVWTIKKTQGDANLYVWDRVNNRNQLIFTPGASSAAALIEIAARLQVDGGLDLQAQQATNAANPTTPTALATKQYVDAAIASVQVTTNDAGQRALQR